MAKHFWRMPRGSRMGVRRFKCDRCNKARYTSKQTAEADIARIQLYGKERETTPIRAYQCPAGWWHLTSKKSEPRPKENCNA